ncbi:hypothetical protein D1872_250540 [compost metagenome]
MLADEGNPVIILNDLIFIFEHRLVLDTHSILGNKPFDIVVFVFDTYAHIVNDFRVNFPPARFIHFLAWKIKMLIVVRRMKRCIFIPGLGLRLYPVRII